ncbi:alpha-L-fucosidase [Rubrolithibacter danxiaensis]|uniref:alpha-L-fucosidase n=1 Tax=Rubrolithibacter danxiaensis TaxID=3390805 RepID=UPI003BF7E95F
MNRLISTALLTCFYCIATAQAPAEKYTPTAENLAARKDFKDRRFGMFIHWGASSVLGDGEWVMNNRNIKVKDYARLQQIFNPVHFDAKKWVAAAKNGGMKYITFITRHHDSFSNWDTKASDFKITNTPYGKDVFKDIAEECHKQGIKLFVYYSLLDWSRDDYPYETGRTGKGTGRTAKSDYAHYLQFMKDQLTELLTNYGPIAGVWFDGHWDQTAPEGEADRSSRIDWKYDEIYSLIHRLQPQCLIGNNHHMTPFEGEDFQMFERDLPGENRSGLSFQKATEHLPVETCETLNGSWGFNITDTKYKSVKEVVHLLVNAAGRDANLLLNIGPLPDGSVQPEFTDTLAAVGTWLNKYGETIYGTRGKIIPPQPWGVVTAKDKVLNVHILSKPKQAYVFVPGINQKVTKAVLLNTNKSITFKQQPEGVFIYLKNVSFDDVDQIVQLQTQ